MTARELTSREAAEIAPSIEYLHERAKAAGYAPVNFRLMVNGCGDDRRSTYYTTDGMGHRTIAHTHAVGALGIGLICIHADTIRDLTIAGFPGDTLRHEYAHLLAPGDHLHGSEWQRAAAAVGAAGHGAKYGAAMARRRSRR